MPPPTVSRDELVAEAIKALHSCTEADKDLTPENTVIAIVGRDEKFRILEGDAVAPYLVGLAGVEREVAPAEAPAAAAAEEAAAAAPAAAAAGGAGGGAADASAGGGAPDAPPRDA